MPAQLRPQHIRFHPLLPKKRGTTGGGPWFSRTSTTLTCQDLLCRIPHLELELAREQVDLDELDGLAVLVDEDLRDGVLNVALDRAAQRPRPCRGLDPCLREQPIFDLVRNLHLQAALGERTIDVVEQDVDDLAQLLRAQRVEDDHLVDPVDELGAERPPELAQDLLLDALEARLLAPLAES